MIFRTSVCIIFLVLAIHIIECSRFGGGGRRSSRNRRSSSISSLLGEKIENSRLTGFLANQHTPTRAELRKTQVEVSAILKRLSIPSRDTQKAINFLANFSKHGSTLGSTPSPQSPGHYGQSPSPYSTIEPTACVGDSGKSCPASTTSLCINNGAVICVASGMPTVPSNNERQMKHTDMTSVIDKDLPQKFRVAVIDIPA